MSLFHPDDRVRYLDKARLWNYITEPKFWMCKREQRTEHDNAKSHVAFIVDHAVEERLLTPPRIIEGICMASLVKHLPTTEIQAILEGVLERPREQAVRRAGAARGGRASSSSTAADDDLDSVINPQVAACNSLVTDGATTETHGVPANRTDGRRTRPEPARMTRARGRRQSITRPDLAEFVT